VGCKGKGECGKGLELIPRSVVPIVEYLNDDTRIESKHFREEGVDRSEGEGKEGRRC
jgi:hypothetical protein